MQPLDWALLPFTRYFDFSGRSSRAEYWYFTAFIWFVSMLILLGQLALGEAVESVLTVVNALFGLVTFIPSMAVAVRRLHDGIHRSGFVLLIYIIGVGHSAGPDAGCDASRVLRGSCCAARSGHYLPEIPRADDQ